MRGIIDSTDEHNPKRRFLSRRQFWMEAGMGIGGLALIDLLCQDQLLAADTSPVPAACMGAGDAASSPLVPKPPHFNPRAKAVISLFMSGGVSHLDTFQYKPALEKYNRLPMEGRGEIKVRQGYPGPLMQSPFSFKQYGNSGAWVSEIFPNIATLVDQLAFVHSCQGTSNDHVISHYEWNTGSVQMGFPSVGSWVTYGLGSVNQNLPGFVVLLDQKGAPYAGPPNWAAGFLPAAYQGTVFRSKGDPLLDLSAPSGYMTPVFMTGAGIEGGRHIGRSDDLGYKAEEQPVTNHDLHATLLHLLGIDHKRLTFYFNGRNMRLTDVSGELIPQIAMLRHTLARAG